MNTIKTYKIIGKNEWLCVIEQDDGIFCKSTMAILKPKQMKELLLKTFPKKSKETTNGNN